MNEMREKLPQYICNCFEVCGYDRVEAITEMTAKSISEIESYIEKKKMNLPSCMRDCHIDQASVSDPFEFPPGHKILISKFIKSVRERTLERTIPEPPSKKRKTTSQSTSANKYEDVSTVSNDICKKIRKWSKDFNNGEFSTMKEGTDYTVCVKVSELTPAICDASIRCKCGNAFAIPLGHNSQRVISNWTRHVKSSKCPNKKTTASQNLSKYFQSNTLHHTSTTAAPSSFSSTIHSSPSSYPNPSSLSPSLAFSPESINDASSSCTLEEQQLLHIDSLSSYNPISSELTVTPPHHLEPTGILQDFHEAPPLL
jgi:hypothetical protein